MINFTCDFILPGLGGRNSEIIYCAGNDSVFTFLQDIFDEILTLFPSRYIHVGGDEARKTNWEKCPLCQKRMKKQHLTNEEDLQGYFMKRISDYLRKKGREVIGWDELTNSSFLPEESIILGWQGMGTAALKAAEKGHRFIMTPARIMYLIRYQGPQWFEPVTYFGNNTLKDVFDYEPVQKDWKPEYESLLMGIQACMWTEFCNKPEDVDYLLFPRLAALAEVAWTPTGTKDWSGFLKRMDVYNAHLAEKGIVYARSMYNIQQTVTPVNGHLEVNLECLRPDVEIRYAVLERRDSWLANYICVQRQSADLHLGRRIDQPHAVHGRSRSLVELSGQALHSQKAVAAQIARIRHGIGNHLAEDPVTKRKKQLVKMMVNYVSVSSERVLDAMSILIMYWRSPVIRS